MHVVYRQMDTCVEFGALCCELTRPKETKEACAKCGPKEDLVVTLKAEYFSNAQRTATVTAFRSALASLYATYNSFQTQTVG